MNPIAKAFFERAILQYNCGDVEYLLQNPGGLAGPLLAVTVNGIDLLGGMLYGFKCPSSKRSIRLMHEHMKMADPVAEMTYRCVRCGIAHEGTPTVRFKFGIVPNRPLPGMILFKDKADKSLVLNVTEFAHGYLRVVKKIAANMKVYVLKAPEPSSRDIESFEKAYESISDDTGQLPRTRPVPPMSSSSGTWIPPGSCKSP